jgi:hypothetical protein
LGKIAQWYLSSQRKSGDQLRAAKRSPIETVAANRRYVSAVSSADSKGSSNWGKKSYLAQAIEYDRLAREAAMPSARVKFTNLEYYRYMARERARSHEVPSTSDDSPAISAGRRSSV